MLMVKIITIGMENVIMARKKKYQNLLILLLLLGILIISTACSPGRDTEELATVPATASQQAAVTGQPWR